MKTRQVIETWILWVFIAGVMLFAMNASAANWMSESDISVACRNTVPVQVYQRRAKCESVEGDSCRDITGKDLCRESVQQVREGAYEAAVAVSDCIIDAADCATDFANLTCPDVSYDKFWGDLDDDKVNEVWCARRALVNRIKPDAGKAATDDAVKANDNAKKTALGTARSNLHDKLLNWGSLTPVERDNALKDAIRLILKE